MSAEPRDALRVVPKPRLKDVVLELGTQLYSFALQLLVLLRILRLPAASDGPIVALLPGYLEGRGCFWPLARHLRDEACQVVVLPALSSLQSIKANANRILPQVEALMRNGPVTFIGHSMGAVVLYQALRQARITPGSTLVSVCGPHRGTAIAKYFPGAAQNVRLSRPPSYALHRIHPVPVLCLGSRADIIVRPRSAALLPASQQIWASGGHSAPLLTSAGHRAILTWVRTRTKPAAYSRVPTPPGRLRNS